MDSVQRLRRTKLQLTHRSSEKPSPLPPTLLSNQAPTPPRFRTNQSNHIYTQTSSRQASRYQTLQHKVKPVRGQRQCSGRKGLRDLRIDTEEINRCYEMGVGGKRKEVTPLFKTEDSATILSRVQVKREKKDSEGKVSYDHLIDAIKLGYSKKQQVITQKEKEKSFAAITTIYPKNSLRSSQPIPSSSSNPRHFSSLYLSTTPSPYDLIHSLHSHIASLRSHIGNNSKLQKIDLLLDEILEEQDEKKSGAEKRVKVEMERNEIQSSLMGERDGKRRFAKEIGRENQMVRTLMEEKIGEKEKRVGKGRQKENQNDKERVKPFKTKSPLREIINYVNKKR